ncbi:MAG: S8 family serine peptidase [Anaerolineaceae bacterium]
MRSHLVRISAIVIALALIISPVSAQVTPPSNRPEIPLRTGIEAGEELSKTNLKLVSAAEGVVNEIEGSTDLARYIIILQDDPVATYKGGIDGLQATAPSETGQKLDVNSTEAVDYVDYLKIQQDAYLTGVNALLGYTPKVLFRYQYATNGMALLLTPEEAALLAQQGGARVFRAPVETPDTDTSVSLIGAPAIWNGETADATATKGEGIIVGIIDTGINFDHPSFAATSTADPYTYTPPAQYYGVCDATNVDQYDAEYAAACNDKLIGAFTYVKGDPDETSTPEDSEGHGSHTASTVAGNVIDVTYQGVATTISGVAPHAQIISFDICVPTPPNGACYGDAAIMAVDDAIASGVDVINYSISGGSDPYNDPVELAFLSATEAGIFVSTSAGNTGDTTGYSSVAHRSPWVSTVAASSTSRIFASAVDITGPGTVPAELVGIGAVQSGTPLTADILDKSIKYDSTNLLGCAAFPADYFLDSIALIQRGTCTFAVKEANAYDAGADYVLIYNSRSGPPVGMSGITTGAAMLSLEDGQAVQAWIEANPTATVSIHADVSRITNPLWQDIIAAFSSFGPNTTFDVLKPDITGPGVNILAAVADGTIAPSADYELDLYQGTSMSSPHNAGSAALIMSLHPTWTPSEVKSALMMTAEDGLTADRTALGEGIRPATPQDEGSGRIALQSTALVGMVMDESIANYEAADPALGGDPASLNLASLYDSKCVGGCSWTRTFTSVADVAATYTVTAPAWVIVTPATFTIDPAGTQEVSFVADVSGLTVDEWQYATIEFNTDTTHAGGALISDLHIPVAILPTSSNIPAFVQLDTHRDAAGQTIYDLEAVEITDGNVYLSGLVKADLETFTLDPDPTPGDPEDDLSQVYVQRIDVPAYSIRVVAEITASTSFDLDMFLYYDLNGDGVLSIADDYLVTQSATGAVLEYINAPKNWIYYNADDTYFIVVQNFDGTVGDSVTLATGVVPLIPDNGNFSVKIPGTQAALDPFSMEILWNEDTEEGDRLYGYFDSCADTECNQQIGSTDLDIRRLADDVVKTADVASAVPGDTITYTIEVTNYDSEFRYYSLNDVLPEGVTYVPDSVTGGATYDPATNSINWGGGVSGVYRDYVMSSSVEDPNCTMPLANSGAYVDLSLYGINPNTSITGEGTWTWTTTGDPITLYGQNAGNNINITDDGYVYLGSPVKKPAVNSDIPDAALPNNLLAFLWRDLEITYDANPDALKGVSTANLTSGGVPVAHIVEMDDVSVKGELTQTYDTEVYLSKSWDDAVGEYEVVFAYDNIAGPLDVGTIGIENADGTQGTKFAYNDAPLASLSNGRAICFDYHLFGDPIVITYQVTVNEGNYLTIENRVAHDNDGLGTVEEFTSAIVTLPTKIFMPIIYK